MITSSVRDQLPTVPAAADNHAPIFTRAAPTVSQFRRVCSTFFSEAEIIRVERTLNSASQRLAVLVGFIRYKVSGSAMAGKELIDAALNNSLDDARKAIARFPDMGLKDATGKNALMHAAINGNVTMAKALLAAGAQVNNVDNDGYSALMLALKNNRMEIAELLLGVNASVNVNKNSSSIALLFAAEKGSQEIVKLLLKKGAAIDARDDNLCTPVMLAAENGHGETVRLLLEEEAGANKLSSCTGVVAKDKYGLTALMKAVDRGHTKVVELLAQKASVDETDEFGRNVLMKAASAGHVDVVSLLLANNASVHAKNIFGGNALMAAASKGSMEVVAQLLAKGAPVDEKDEKGWTALMYAAAEGHEDVFKLLYQGGASMSEKSKNGETVLMLVASRGLTGIVNLLLQNNASPDEKDANGQTALMKAASKEHTEVVKLLSVDDASRDTKDLTGRTALIYAAMGGHYATISKLIENCVDQHDALLSVLQYGDADITTVIVRAWLNSAKNKLDAATAIKCVYAEKSNHAGARKFEDVDMLHALANAGLTLTTEYFAKLKLSISLSEDAQDHLKSILVDPELPDRFKIGNAYWSGKHALVDELIDAPFITKSNPLGLSPSACKKAFNPEHLISAKGEYQHAIGQLHDQSPKLDSRCDVDPMTQAGWRSMVTVVLRSARNAATEASQQISNLLADPKRRLHLIDELGQPVAANSIRLTDTLFALELERNEPLNQIVEPPKPLQPSRSIPMPQDSIQNEPKNQIIPTQKSPPASTFLTTKQENHQEARTAQAEAILASNKMYSRLKLNMPALTQAKEVEKKVRYGLLSGASAAVELDKLLAETEQTFFEAPGMESELAYHWFISEVKEVCDTLKEMADGFRTLNPTSLNADAQIL